MFINKIQESFRKWLKRGALVAFLLVIILFISWWQLIKPAGSGDNLKPFFITSGQSVKIIGYNLKQSGLIKSQFWFESWVWFIGAEKKFMAGDYRLPPSVNIINLTSLLTGRAALPDELKVVMIEGWTIADMADYLAASGIYNKEEFKKFVTEPSSFNALLSDLEISLSSKPAGSSLEGYLFPDTYRIYKDSQPSDLVLKMLANFASKFKTEWKDKLNTRGYNVFQAVTLASIVEKEVPHAEDRKLVADIFWRRLAAGQGLEADSTINYITGKNNPSSSLADLKINSPYNTYRYRGLPPGPICNPGETSLEAVVNPTPNNYWYFLTAKDGQVIYSHTFEEHKIAKQKYLR